MTQTETEPVSQTEASRGGNLPCPRCGEVCGIALDLDDLETCRCRECEENFTLDDVRAITKAWAPVLAWIDSSPKFGE